jgi:hypothetical protein
MHAHGSWGREGHNPGQQHVRRPRRRDPWVAHRERRRWWGHAPRASAATLATEARPGRPPAYIGIGCVLHLMRGEGWERDRRAVRRASRAMSRGDPLGRGFGKHATANATRRPAPSTGPGHSKADRQLRSPTPRRKSLAWHAKLQLLLQLHVRRDGGGCHTDGWVCRPHGGGNNIC